MKIASAQLDALSKVITALAKNPDYSKTTLQLKLLLERLQKENTPKTKGAPGIGVNRAIAAMREVLGVKLAVPKNPTTSWIIPLANRIKALGLTEEDCKTIARAVQVKWQNPPYGFEYCIRAADRLLAESEQVVVKGKGSTPVEMDEWE